MTRLLLALVLAAAITGCGKDATTPTSATTTTTGAAITATRLFSGTLAAKDTQFYSFTVAQDSGVFVTLASVTATDSRAATTTSVGIGLGVPRGTGCALSTRAVVSSALTPQVREVVAAGVHCVAIYDPGTLSAAVNYAVRIGYFK